MLFSGDAAGAAAAAVAEVAWTAAAPPADDASHVAERAARDASASARQAGVPHELVVVDARVPDLAATLTELEAQRAAGRDLVVVALHADDDGLAAIGDALHGASQAGTPFDAVHLIGHGEPGAMRLGGATLDLDALRARAGEFADWADGLSGGADLLLWGCDVAAHADGRALLAGLASLTGADVAASLDATGGLRHGGDWSLEARVGDIGTAVPIGASLQAGFDGLLGPDPLAGQRALATAPGRPWSSSPGAYAIATGPSNVTVVVWRDGAESGLTAQRSDAYGVALGGPIAVPGTAAAAGTSVAVDATGRFVVVWTDADGQGVFGQRFDASGAATGARMRIDAGVTRASDVDVAMNAAGRFVVAWTDASGGSSAREVGARAFGPDGSPAIGVLDVGSLIAGDPRNPAVAIGDDGRFAVAFESEEALGFGEGVYLSRHDADGTRPFPFLPLPVALALGDQVAPDIAVDAAGDYVVVWADRNGAEPGIHGQRIDAASGLAIGSDFRIDDGSVGSAANPAVAALPRGGFVVAWDGDAGGGAGREVLAREFGPLAVPSDEPFAIAAATVGEQTRPALAAGDGRTTFVWASTASGSDTLATRPFEVDAPGLTLRPVATTIDESGPRTGALTVVLDVAPTADVVVTLSLDRPAVATLSTTTIRFTPADWSTARTVTITGIDDAVDRPDQPVTVRAVASSADDGYDDLDDSLAGFTVVDDDIAGVVLNVDGATTSEGGGTRTVSVRLQSQPLGRVAVDLAVSDGFEARLAGTSLQFTAANWNVAQTVVLAGVDDPVVDGTRAYTVTAIASSTDLGFDGRTAVPLAMTNLDDDTRNRVVVDTAADVVDGDAGSLAALWRDRGADGRVSLREALQAAQATPNGPGGIDLVAFDLGAAGTRTIALQSALQAITDPVAIDATTDPAYAGRPVVGIDGRAGAGDGLVLAVGSDGSVVRGLSITGNPGAGLRIASSGVLVESNHVGLDASGLVAAGNGGDGVRIEGGGAQVVRGNAIGGNGGDGVVLAGAQGARVTDNRIGVAIDDATALGNGGDGVSLSAGAADNRVDANVIGGNGGAGVRLAGAGTERNVVIGNAIGTDRGGIALFGNSGGGVLVLDGAASNRIGGVAAGEGNLIVGNGPVGVQVSDASGAGRGNAILSNRIDGHGLGIDLSADGTVGPTPNDPGDADVGGNGLLNAPVLDWARLAPDGSTVTLSGRVEGAPGERLRIEVFADPVPHPSGRGEGPRLVGAFDVFVDAGGLAAFVRTFAAAGVLAGGHAVSATVTRPNAAGTTWSDSSEFSVGVRAGAAPAISAPTDFVTPENAPFEVTLRASDADSPLAALSWSIVGGPDAGRFAIDAASGMLRLVDLPDFERPADANADGVHEVDVRVVGPQGLDDVRRIRVAVLDVAEAPIARGPAAVAAVEDTVRLLSTDDGTALTITDDDALAASQAVELSVDRGTLTLASIAGLRFDVGDGSGDATMRFSGSAADVAAALVRLGYAPLPDQSGAAELRLSVADAGDASLSSAIRVAITIAPSNDAPALAASGPLSVAAGGSAALDATRLRAVDVDDGPAAIVFVIEQAPPGGALRLDGRPLVAGDRFTQVDLDAGRVRYDAPADAGARTLVVSVRDPSGAGPSGVSIAIDVTAAPEPAPAPAPAPTPAIAPPTTVPTPPSPAAPATPAAVQPVLADEPGAAAATSVPSPGAAAVARGSAEERLAVRSDAARADAPAFSAVRIALDASAAAADGSDPGRSAAPPAASHDGLAARSAALVETPASEASRPAIDPAVARAWSPVEALRQVAFREALDQNRVQAASGLEFDRAVVASSAALTTGVAVGYALWLLRGGVLLASLLASMPAWRAIDPLPVLGRLDARGRDDADEDDSLRGMLRDADRDAPGGDGRGAREAADGIAVDAAGNTDQATPAEGDRR